MQKTNKYTSLNKLNHTINQPFILGDIVFKAPTIQNLQLHSLISRRRTYAYEFTQFRRQQGRLFEGPTFLRTGANHEDELPYVFGYPLLPEEQCWQVYNVPECKCFYIEHILKFDSLKCVINITP